MIRFELDELNAIPEWRPVLAAYRERGAAARAAAPDFDGWLPRLRSIDGVAEARLPAIHGRLMALGFLRFQIAGRSAGLQYQLTPEGRQALDTSATEADFAASLDSPADPEQPACVLHSF
ncbi:MAG TPA: hypothetical protein VML55_14615 [Planctomycetaceae bacterium]|nr:hypothetical protein [Planctomycetaceae bacterium]